MTDLLTAAHARTAVVPSEPDGYADVPPSSLTETVAADLVLAVAPSTGRFRPVTQADSPLAEGTVLGHVTGGRGRADAVTAPVGAHLARLLVRPGQLVRRGQCLAWLQRDRAA